MNKVNLSFSVVLIAGIVGTLSAANVLDLKIGLTWPSVIWKENSKTRVCGDAGFDYGLIVDKKVSVGVAGNFLWNRVANEKDTTVASLQQSRMTRDEKSFMFPICGFITVDPMTQWIIHPAARFQIGYNSMVYSLKQSEPVFTASDTIPPRDFTDYYFGLFIRAGGRASYNISEMSAVMFGVDYQWAQSRTAANKNGFYKKKDMSGPAIYVGFQIIY